jgi:hypothetical protein
MPLPRSSESMMRLSFSYFKIYFLSTIRNTPALFLTLIFPPLLLLMTGHQWGANREDQIHAFIIFCNYSVQTVALMVLGMGVSAEKNSYWSAYLRSLPVGIFPMIVGRTLHTLGLSLINLMTISIVGILILSIPVSAMELSYFILIALFGAIPMALMGMTIGYAANPESSRSIFTLLNLLLLFGSFSLPATGFFAALRQGIPSYQWTILSSKIVDPNLSVTGPLVCFGAYFLVFLFLFRRFYHKI